MNWNFSKFGFKELILNQCKSLPASSCCKFADMVFKCSPQEFKVLSSTKFQISVFSMTKNNSFINILNKKSPNMEPCRIWHLISDQLLKDERALFTGIKTSY